MKLTAPSKSLEGSQKRSTFEIVVEAGGAGDAVIDSDVELEVSTLIGEPGDPTCGKTPVVEPRRLEEERDPDRAASRGSPESKKTLSSLDSE